MAYKALSFEVYCYTLDLFRVGRSCGQPVDKLTKTSKVTKHRGHVCTEPLCHNKGGHKERALCHTSISSWIQISRSLSLKQNFVNPKMTLFST